MGFLPGLKAFVAAVFGGIGIIPGAMIGGYFIGIVETFVFRLRRFHVQGRIVFAILILVLIIKPPGCWANQQERRCNYEDSGKTLGTVCRLP